MIYINRGLLLRFSFEFSFDCFDIYILNNRLGVLILQGLASNGRLSLIFAVFSLKSCYWHITIL